MYSENQAQNTGPAHAVSPLTGGNMGAGGWTQDAKTIYLGISYEPYQNQCFLSPPPIKKYLKQCSLNQYLVNISFRQFAKFSGVRCDAYFIW